MGSAIPAFLILGPERLKLEYRAVLQAAETRSAILVSGPRMAFVTFTNVILFYLAELANSIRMSSLPFVDCAEGMDLLIDVDLSCRAPQGWIRQTGQRTFCWTISEENLTLVVGLIHSLGYANDHIHIDEGMCAEGVSIYCEVEEDP